MLAAVKVFPTSYPTLEVKGAIPRELMDFLQSHYGEILQIVQGEEDLINPGDGVGWKSTACTMTPGRYLRMCREKAGLTQAQLAGKLGKTHTRISELERGVRGISKEAGKQLAHLFKVPIEPFF